jgi:hypothetical protein
MCLPPTAFHIRLVVHCSVASAEYFRGYVASAEYFRGYVVAYCVPISCNANYNIK